jgi:O-succinylhomoserine sulfhydrylase
MKKYKNFETNAIRTQIKKSDKKEHSTAIYATSSFVFENAEEARAIFAEEKEGYQYSRFANPNEDEFISKMCLLEGTEDGISTATGMASIFLAMTSHLRAGDHIVSSQSIFGATHSILTNILPRFGISHSYVDINDNQQWEEAIMPQTRLLFVETPSNPTVELCDLAFLGKLAKKNNLLFVVDNSFATPYLQNPINFGANLVCHSATKFIDGQGRTLGGVILGPKNVIKDVRIMARSIGTNLSPFNSWILSKSLETLAIRMDRHCENALNIAQYLKDNKEVISVNYPFLKENKQYKLAKNQMSQGGALISFELNGGKKRGLKFLDQLKMITLASNLGDSRTIITNPATTTHSKLSEEERLEVNITDGLMRLSVGLENVQDIIADIQQAIEKTTKN